MYKVIGTPNSRAFRVMWMLEELNQPYEVIPATPRSEEAMQHNPLGKIPALVDGDAVLTDSVAIMTYLADKHQMLTAPAGTPDRARQDAMTLWIIDELDATLWTAAKHTFALPEKLRMRAIKDTLYAEFTHATDLLAQRLDGEFLMGDAITLPDILAVHCLNWSISAKFPRYNETLTTYAKRLRDRPAFKAARAR